MIVNHNLPAMNANRQMGINNTKIASSLEKLSSGLGINRAADNAAGLAISEKMRGQISGLDQATSNAEDGISLIQTAEGALNETQSILQRMRELSVQSANGTYQDDVDRENIQKEVEALKSEVDRISSSTHYNGIQLLDGSLSGSDVIEGVKSTKVDGVKAVYTSTAAAAPAAGDTVSSITIGYTDADGNAKTYVFSGTGAATAGTTITDAATSYAATIKDTAGTYSGNSSNAIANAEEFNKLFDVTASTGTAGALAFTAKTGGKQTITSVVAGASGAGDITTATVTATTAKVNAKLTVSFGSDATGAASASTVFSAGSTLSLGGTDFYFYDSANASSELTTAKDGYTCIDITAAGGTPLNDTINEVLTTIDTALGATTAHTATTNSITIQGLDFDNAPELTLNGLTLSGTTDGKKATDTTGVTFQIGANGTADQSVTLQVGNQSAAGLGINSIDCSTQDGANSAIEVIDDAINSVSGTRADLGALQNRMEHTINSLGVSSENLTAAESRIRDVDMAAEMMEFTKNQILSQASQAMLAQANTLPQGVLQLLQ